MNTLMIWEKTQVTGFAAMHIFTGYNKNALKKTTCKHYRKKVKEKIINVACVHF